jgi:tRNA threonylcarbamoyladenosine biosynthesis protein TsaB
VIVLGFDTATAATAVALRLAGGSTLRAREDPGAQERPGHTTRLLALASGLLAQGGLRWGDVTLVAVGVGPGTFTGLRIGVATARGLAQSLGIDVVGVGTPQVLAEAALADRDVQRTGRNVLAVIDARRGEVFLAAYAREHGQTAQGAHAGQPPAEVGRHGAGLGLLARELSAPRALPPDRAAGMAAATGAVPDWLAVGDGAVRFRAQLEADGVAVAAEDSPLHRVDAGVLCELALAAPRGAPEAVLPDYRRRPDAEIALENAEQ